MLRFAANITTLFKEYDFLDRFHVAHSAGFEAIECQLPYAFDAEIIAEKLREHELQMVLHNFPVGDWSLGDRGIACNPRKKKDFQESIYKAVHYAKTLKCQKLNCLSGISDPSFTHENTYTTFVDNLRLAANILEKEDIQLVSEPINKHDIPNFFLSDFELALTLLHDVDHPNFKIQCDMYHLAKMETSIIDTLAQHLEYIGHFQFADFPQRHEPGTGTIDFDLIFDFIKTSDYSGWVSAEYVPSKKTLDSLTWMKKYVVKFNSTATT